MTTPPAPLPIDSAAERGVDRRGPFRPDRLVTLRDRQSRREAAHGFRLVDVIALVLVFGIVLRRAEGGRVLDLTTAQVLPVAAAAATSGRLLRSVGLYRFRRHESIALHLLGVIGTVAVGVIVGLLVALAIGGRADAADVVWWSVPAAVVLVGLHLTWSLIVRRWRRDGRLTPNLVIVGATSHAEQLVREALAERDVNVLGVFDDRLARSPQDVAGVPVLGDVASLLSHRITPFVDLIVIAVDPTARARVEQVMSRLAALPNEVALVVDEPGGSRHAAIRRLADAPLSPLDVVADPGRRAFAKRLQDLVLAALGIVVVSPVIGAVALAVRLDSPGPVFFRQRRHGFNNEEIVVWKFRTMRHELADARAERQVTAGDERVTRVGRLLRSTSLDELPQLLNVLAGTMSLVGPRPHAIGMRTGDEDAAAIVAGYARRHRIKPGMTGWAAIKGSRGPVHTADDVRRRVMLDVHYIDRQSFWLDVWIMLMTVPSLFGDRHAIR